MSGTLGTGQLSGPLRAALASLLTLLLVGGCSAEEPLAEFLEREEKKYSQNDEELLIRHFFRDRRGGVFVDVGAFQWRKYSTTFYLEEQLGWSGLAIDANARLAAGYAKNRPNTRFYSYIVTDRSGTEEEFFLAGPISSTSKEHIEGLGREGREVAVETITLDELLDQAGIESIDFLSMDIEGGEPRALRHRALSAETDLHRGRLARDPRIDRPLLRAARVRADRGVSPVRSRELVLPPPRLRAASYPPLELSTRKRCAVSAPPGAPSSGPMRSAGLGS